jgi:hypothetical protein
MPTCHRHYPGRSDGVYSLVPLHRPRPSLCNSQVGSCNCFFGACSAFTHVMACTLAESPSNPLHRKLRQLRYLRCRFDCYRVERTSSWAGVAPAEVQRLSRRTFSPTIHSRRRCSFLRLSSLYLVDPAMIIPSDGVCEPIDGFCCLFGAPGFARIPPFKNVKPGPVLRILHRDWIVVSRYLVARSGFERGHC